MEFCVMSMQHAVPAVTQFKRNSRIVINPGIDLTFVIIFMSMYSSIVLSSDDSFCLVGSISISALHLLSLMDTDIVYD